METNFETIKEEILRRAKDAHACKEQYTRAFKSETLSQLCTVVKDNFPWACRTNVIDSELLMQYREEFAANDIYVNTSVRSGCLLCDNATVEAYGNANVEACDNATVKACGNATVEAYGNATVKACGNATVKACDSATVKAYGNATVEAYGNATVKACDNATVEACGNATVEAYGNAYCASYSMVGCKLNGNAIYRVRSTNTIYYASDDLKFVKQI